MLQNPVVHRIQSAIECFTEKYKKLPLLEKILDGMLIGALIVTFLSLVLEHTILHDPQWIHILHRVNLAIGIVFLADLIRTFRKSNHWGHFVRHHWIDMAAVAIVLIAFSSLYYPAAGRVSYLLKAQKLHKVTHFYHLTHLGKVLA